MSDDEFKSPYEIDKKTRISLEVVIALTASVIGGTWSIASSTTNSQAEMAALHRLENKVDELVKANNIHTENTIKIVKDIESLQRDVRRIKKQKAPKWDEE